MEIADLRGVSASCLSNVMPCNLKSKLQSPSLVELLEDLEILDALLFLGSITDWAGPQQYYHSLVRRWKRSVVVLEAPL